MCKYWKCMKHTDDASNVKYRGEVSCYSRAEVSCSQPTETLPTNTSLNHYFQLPTVKTYYEKFDSVKMLLMTHKQTNAKMLFYERTPLHYIT